MRPPEVPSDAGSPEGEPHHYQDHQQTAARRRTGALDSSALHVQRPGQHQGEGEPDAERDHGGRENPVGKLQPVHHRLDDLKDGEGNDPVSDESAENPPALHLCEPGLHAADDSASHCRPASPEVQISRVWMGEPVLMVFVTGVRSATSARRRRCSSVSGAANRISRSIRSARLSGSPTRLGCRYRSRILKRQGGRTGAGWSAPCR